MLVVGVIIANAATVAVCCLILWATGPGRTASRSRRRQLERRRDHLRAHPDQVGYRDVELLLTESLPAARAQEACRGARARRVPPLVLWTWVELYDADLLALAVEAGLTSEELLHHVATGTPPDRRSLEIFAAFHGSAAS